MLCLSNWARTSVWVLPGPSSAERGDGRGQEWLVTVESSSVGGNYSLLLFGSFHRCSVYQHGVDSALLWILSLFFLLLVWSPCGSEKKKYKIEKKKKKKKNCCVIDFFVWLSAGCSDGGPMCCEFGRSFGFWQALRVIRRAVFDILLFTVDCFDFTLLQVYAAVLLSRVD